MGFDAAKSTDAYANMIAQQQLYVDSLVEKKGNLTKACEQSETTMENNYTDYRVSSNLFQACSDEKATLEANLKKLEDEKSQQIRKLEEKMENEILQAKRDGKSETDIKAIRTEYSSQIYIIENSYADKIKNLSFNVSRAGATSILKQKTLAESEEKYRGSRFDNIFAMGNFLSNQNSLFSAYLDLGRMQQNQFIFENMQQKGWDA